MPILVKHSGNVAPTAVGAFAGGKAKREVFEEEQAMTNIRQQRQISAAAREAEASRAFAAEQADLSREFQANQAGLNRDQTQTMAEDSRTFAADQAVVGRDWARTQTDEARDWDLKRSQFGDQQARDRFTWELTEKQKRDDDRLAQAAADIMATDYFTPEQKDEALRAIDAKRAGIQPVKTRQDGTKTPAESFAASTYTDPKTGVVFAQDQSGKWASIHEPKEKVSPKTVTAKDVGSLYMDGIKALTRTEMVNGTSTTVTPNPKEVRKFVKDMIALQQELVSDPTGDAGQPDQPGGDPSTQNQTLPDGQPVKPISGQPSAVLQNFRNVMKQGAGGATAVAPKTGSGASGSWGDAVSVSTEEEYNKLPKGTLYKKPDGTVRRKN